MGVVNLPSGRPTMRLTGGALERLKAITPAGHEPRIDVTITDEYPIAQAFVIISAEPQRAEKGLRKASIYLNRLTNRLSSKRMRVALHPFRPRATRAASRIKGRKADECDDRKTQRKVASPRRCGWFSMP
jgi:hypothetical protein